ncbi:DUF4214 domain-containing protein [Acidithiobacillus sp. HP-6]|uniref:DUF4214 domain-containing protein n=1 Tax=unclassified Acidithiobacillus TaxID=2614800 RepID=UPI00187B0559|nr:MULTISPECIES: DUF4214 domain-containing protein [unclassified Acidithiobacillus]MBE7564243.1 DUF4214 domain-containing protein [Acidithiobacillus sp. HP-6]MBE7570906.1 DUF4214 domain-containing protein [Acidithiobacillus sp. HP-2]
MPIQNITELFALDGREFVTEAYRSLLNREPDVQGMAYYLGRLAQGRGKYSVIVQLSKSLECKPHDQLEGLKELIENYRRSHHWFWGRFAIHSRVENTLQSCLFSFERLTERFFTEQLVQVQRELSTLREAQVIQNSLQQANDDLERKNTEILHNFLAQQEGIEVLILEDREKESRLVKLEQQKNQLEEECAKLADMAVQRESELADLYQTKKVLEKENAEILYNFLAQQEEMEVLILARRENKNLEQHKFQFEEEKNVLLKQLDDLRAQLATLQQDRDEQAWYAAERLAWLKNMHISDM